MPQFLTEVGFMLSELGDQGILGICFSLGSWCPGVLPISPRLCFLVYFEQGLSGLGMEREVPFAPPRSLDKLGTSWRLKPNIDYA